MILNSINVKMLQNDLGQLSTKKLSVESLKSLLNLEEELDNIVTSVAKTQEKIFSGYGIKKVNGTYDWKDHEDGEEIEMKVKEIMNSEHELVELNFLTEEEFYSSVAGMKLFTIKSLKKHLLNS